MASGGWRELSLAEQLGNVGSEVSRASRWQGKDDGRFWGAVGRAFELLDLTIGDPRHRGRLREIVRAREVLADAVLGGKEYGTTLPGLLSYFDRFAIYARR